MAISCAASDLEVAAKAFMALSRSDQWAVQTYLLASINGGSMSPQVLLAAAQAFQVLNPPEQMAVQNYLLCQIVNK